ncbi:hypothetical protein ONK27_27350, partial [Salmonella enterica subsp. enterica serovar Virginia]|nr:hypothetical protein [Salmonella enterica subsp. enterica serovar Virginia]
EGHWENTPGEPTPLTLVGWPDMEAERTRYALEIPALGSLILTAAFGFPTVRTPIIRPSLIIGAATYITVLLGSAESFAVLRAPY